MTSKPEMEGAKGDTKAASDELLVGNGAGVEDFSGHRAIQIVKINEEDHSFTLDEDALNDILNNDKVKDKPVCVVSVAGKPRSDIIFRSSKDR